MATDAAALFSRRFGGRPEFVVRSPGRVNLIGDHTDYNDGFVLPMAIDLGLMIAARRRSDDRLSLWSTAEPQPAELNPRETTRPCGWAAYPWAVARALQDSQRPVTGLDGVIAGRLPPGSGLSSSAALEMAVCRALIEAAGQPWDPKGMALLCQRAENELVGNRCGIMDQLCVGLARSGHALLIDCRSLGTEHVSLPRSAGIVVCDSGKRRTLTNSAYNDRRAECEAAAAALGVSSLRDVDQGRIASAGLSDLLRRRAEHVVSENRRVLQATDALRVGDLARLGGLMRASHASLRDLFEVSCAELDLLVDIAAGLPGCFGSRMTGAGFGGCTVSLVDADEASAFGERLVDEYRRQTGLEARAYICQAVDGVDVESLG